MPLFCQICQNLLVEITTADNFYFKCSKCQNINKPSNADTMRYEDITGTDLLMYKTILQHAGDDPVNPKVQKDCSCGGKFARQVRLGDDLKLINICITCKKQWI